MISFLFSSEEESEYFLEKKLQLASRLADDNYFELKNLDSYKFSELC